MVLRTTKPQSPVKTDNQKMTNYNGTNRKTPSPSSQRQKLPVRSTSLSNGLNKRGVSPSRSLNGKSPSRKDSSPQRNAPILIRSRGSE